MLRGSSLKGILIYKIEIRISISIRVSVGVRVRCGERVMHKSIPGETPPPEHARAFDLIGYDIVNARVPGHNLRLMHGPWAS